MFPSWATDLIDSLSFDALVLHLRGVVEYARSDWVGFSFWAVVWTGSFVTTGLLLRMLFTRWGDTNVTRKTMAVSLMAHLVLGLLSTQLVFSHSKSGGRGSPSEIILRPSRRTIIEGNQSATGRSPQETPVWDRQPQFESAAPSRVPKAEAESPELDTIAREASLTTTPVQLPDLPAPDAAPAAPEPARGEPDPVPRATLDQSSIREETAQARAEPERSTPTPPRTARSDSLPGEESPQRPVRMQKPEEQREALPPVIVGAVVPDAKESPTIERGAPAVRGTRAAEPASIPAAEGAAGAPAPEAATEKGFTRSGRRQGAEVETPDIPRTRSSESAAPLDLGAARAVASRSDSSSAFPDGLKPDVLRSDSAGAIDINAGKVPAPYRLRGLPQRKQVAIEMGATEESERAVEASLQWLARHQHPDGYWQPVESTLGKEPVKLNFTDPNDRIERERSGLQAESGLTALALLAFLGANHTHEDNIYSDNVDRALRWLVAQQESNGYLGGRANKYAGMYCHGMATIALGEAYGMTKDPALRDPLMRAVQYIIDRQNPTDGGWRYNRSTEGDMSMFGWQLMALKSAHTAGLKVPKEPVQRAIDFLNRHSGEMRTRGLSRSGGLAAYKKEEAPKPSMTAEALFCKQMLGLKRDDPSVAEALDYLLQHAPRRSQQDLYYWYYGTLALYHHGGEPWRRWNQAMRDNLVADQRTDGDFAGSWNPRAPWGDYGGRVFSTAISTLCLEVYYRFLPLYQMSARPDETGKKQ